MKIFPYCRSLLSGHLAKVVVVAGVVVVVRVDVVVVGVVVVGVVVVEVVGYSCN